MHVQSPLMALPDCLHNGAHSFHRKPGMTLLVCVRQAFVKARGDGLGFDLGKAEFHLGPMQAGLQDATVFVDGQTLTR